MSSLGFPLGDQLGDDAPTGNRLETLLSILLKPFQRIENAMIQLLTLRSVDTATGAQLDVLGKIVGQQRQGFVDVDYRRYIRARIATNRATGKRSDYITIARLIVNDLTAKVYIEPRPPACVLIRIDNVPETAAVETALVAFLTQAAGNGVRVLVQTRPATPALTFKFSGGALTGPGWDNAASPGSGGQISDMRESV